MLELCQILDVGQPALSHHLKILASSGLLETRREGTSHYYRRALVDANDPIKQMRKALFDTLDQVPLEIELQERIGAVHRARHERSVSFFEKNARRFQDNQDLIVEYDDYAECLNQVLANESLEPDARVIEVGPGDSDLLCNLAARFSEVIAIDNSAEMLSLAEQRASQRDHNNITFVSGELKDTRLSADLIVTNMVMHHLASPANFFNEAHAKLNSSGCFLTADLLAHDQDWTRDACGDLWLGFDPDELDTWAATAGFINSQSQYLGLNNGFQVQVRTYIKKAKQTNGDT